MTLPRCLFLGLLVWCAWLPWSAAAGDIDKLKVGLQPDGRIVVPTNQILKPAGKQLTFPGRPTALLLIETGKTLVVQNKNGLVFIDTKTETIKQTLAGAGMSVTGLAERGGRVFTSDAKNQVRVAGRQKEGDFAWEKPITLARPKVGGATHPAGLAFENDDLLWVASTRGNNVQRLNVKTGKVEQVIDVGVAPFTICFTGPDRAYVSNWGGEPPKDGEPQGVTSKTPVKVDPRTGVANHGSVSVLERVGKVWKKTGFVEVGLHPCALLASPKGGFLYVANANSDTVSVIATKNNKVVETIECRPENRLPFGSGCNALALDPTGTLLFVANGTNNCLTVVHLSERATDAIINPPPGRRSEIQGLIPTGWYPGGIQIDNNKLFVANVKGHGSVGPLKKGARGHNSHDFLGSVSILRKGTDTLKSYTAQVNANNRLTFSLMGLEKPRKDARPVPVPQRHGEPSVFKHVVYIIKENRTYDQVFGDMKEGNGDPKLVMFGEKVTPNLHRLARQFALFDNFYCSGVLSADGHSWCNEAYVTDYLERSFGGFTRSYPYEGSDNLAFAPCGFLWDNALLHKKTFRNYGEFARTSYTPAKAAWTDVYNDYKNGTNKVKINVKPNLKTLEPFTHPHFPGFPLTTPDVYRAKLFINELKQFEQKGDFPNLVYLFLPNDHTNGTKPGWPTPRAMVADNDLAVGQVIEAISKSKFWKETCIFIVEDDPQNGFDHVDGHRTVALVISPYTKRKFVDSTNYNQTGMVRTIELLLGLPPMNQLDLSATPMRHCFQDTPDLTPYSAVPNQVPLDEMNPPLKKLTGKALYWAKKALELPLDEADQVDEDLFNRMLWFATHGEEPYPIQYIGRRALGRERVDGE